MTSTSRPAHRAAVRPAAVATISSMLTASLCRNRVSRSSPARSRPRRRTLIPRALFSTRRACSKIPTASRRASPNFPSEVVVIPGSLARIGRSEATESQFGGERKKMCECGSWKGEAGWRPSGAEAEGQDVDLAEHGAGQGEGGAGGVHDGADGAFGEGAEHRVPEFASILIGDDGLTNGAGLVGGDGQHGVHLVEVEGAGIGGPAGADVIADGAALGR